jgi:hypothetical protein
LLLPLGQTKRTIAKGKNCYFFDSYLRPQIKGWPLISSVILAWRHGWRWLHGSMGFLSQFGSPRRPHKYPNYFHHEQLTLADPVVIIEGFARKSGEFCPAEALQVVCGVDDGPKTD